MGDGESPGFSTTTVGFFNTNVPSVLQFASGAIQLQGFGAEKGDSG
jgi:hypothetical protein